MFRWLAILLLLPGLAYSRPDGQLPVYLLELPASVTTVLVAETDKAALHRVSNEPQGLEYADERYMSIGQNGVGKQRPWDRRTPLGVYFITEQLDTTKLHERYGPFQSVITHSFGGPCLAAAMQDGMTTSSVVSIAPPAHVDVLIAHFADTLSIPEKGVNDFIRRFEVTFGKDILQRASMVNMVCDFDQPALVIHDEDDADIPWQEGQAVASAWQHARFLKTNSFGHRRILRDPGTVAAVVDFVQSNSA